MAERLDWASKAKIDRSPDPKNWADLAKEQSNAVAEPFTELGPPGLEDIGARFDLARMDTFEEKRKKFRELYPEGDLERLPVEGSLLFRTKPDEKWRKVDAGLLEKREIGADIVDLFSDDIGATIGEVAVSLIPQFRGLGFLKQMAKYGAAAAAGDVAQQGAEQVAGENLEPIENVAARTGLKGGMAAGGEALIGRPLAAMSNATRGAGVLNVPEGARQALGAAESLNKQHPGLNFELLPGEVSDNPIVRRLHSQTATVLPSINRQVTDRSRRLADVVSSARDTPSRGMLRENVEQAFEAERDAILRDLKDPGVSRKEAGQTIREGLLGKSRDSWQARAQQRVTQAYRAARDAGSPDFDIDPILETAKRIEDGVRAAPKKGDEAIRVGGEVHPEVARVIEAIKKIDLTKGGEGISEPVEVLKELRSQLFELQRVPEGEVFRQAQHGYARDLYRAFSEVLDNPSGGDEAVRAAWRKANKLASERFKTIEALDMVGAYRNEGADALAERLMRPVNEDTLSLLKQTLTDKEFSTLQNAFQTRLIREGADDIMGVMKKYDRETLDLLIPKMEQQRLRTLAQRMNDLQSTNAQQALERQSRNYAFLSELIDRGDSAGVQNLYKVLSKGGKDSPAMKSMRAAMVDELVRAGITVGEQGRYIVNENAAKALLERWSQNGAARFLRPEDFALVKNLRKIVPWMQVDKDFGSQLLAAQVVSNIRDIATPGGHTAAQAVSVIHKLIELAGVGRAYTNPHMRKFLIGSGGKKRPFEAFHAFGAITGELSAPSEDIGTDGN